MATAPLTINNKVIQEFLWEGVAGQGTINMVVVQEGHILRFYKVSASNSLDSGFFFDIDFSGSGFNRYSDTVFQYPCSFASGFGYLFVAHPYLDPIYIKYDVINDVLIPNVAVLQQRDFAGVVDGQTTNQRVSWPGGSSVPSDLHFYNLMNQGWANCTEGAAEPQFGFPGYVSWVAFILQFCVVTNTFPSNADVWWNYKDVNGIFDPQTTISKVGYYNTAAPQGHFILDCFNQDRSAAFAAEQAQLYQSGYGVSSIPVVSASTRPSCVAFFAGRAWFAGVSDTNFTNQIYYSRIIQQDQHISQCYQDNDPTADDTGVADLIASDGGVLVEPDIGTIYKLFPVAYSLMIFASNGIWQISGSTGSGFTATDFSLSKISSIGMLSAMSFMDFDGIPIWWNLNGIYTLQYGGIQPNGMGGTQVVSMTDSVIKDYFNSIPPESKRWVKGSYNRRLYSIYYLYRSTAPTTITEQFQYDSVLIHNTITKSWYTWTLPTTFEVVCGIVTIQGQGTDTSVQAVLDGSGNPVLDGAGDPINSFQSIVEELSSVTKFLVQYPNLNIEMGNLYYFGWAEISDASYTDFGKYDYLSYATSGYALDGQGIARFQSPYLVFYLRNNIASAVNVSVSWDYANSIDTGKNLVSQTTLQTEGTRWDYVPFRRKFRGGGRAMQVHFESITGQPFEVAGWAIEVSTNTGA